MKNTYDLDFSKYLEYNTLSPTGLVWKPRDIDEFTCDRACSRFNNNIAGEPAGCLVVDKSGYRLWRLILLGMNYTNSKIIYTMLIGNIPEGFYIDHIDNNSLNNKIENFRLATQSQNYANAKCQKSSSTGIKGVKKVYKRFSAKINGNHIGTFNTAEEANEAYKIAAIEKYGEFARYN